MQKHRLYPCLVLSLSLSILVACGPESSSYTPVQDTVTVESTISIDAQAQIIHVLNKDASARSETIEDCTIGFEKENLAFSFTGAEALILGSASMEYVRPLAVKAASSEVDERLFAVWKVPAHMVGLVSYNIEVEIQADKIIYRNTCIR